MAGLGKLFPLVRSKSGSITYSGRFPPNDRLERVVFIANWIETHLRIVTKDKRLVFLVFNAFQWILLQYLAWCAAHDLPVQAIVPKGRQGGVSTFVQAWNFACAVLNDRSGKAYRAVTVAHTEQTALTIFRMSRLFERKLPSAWAVELESKQKGLLEWPNAGAWVRVATVKSGDALERGSTINSFHGSECGSWADEGVDPGEAYTAVMGAVADGPDSMVVLESTPKGRDAFFFRMIDEALQHKNTFRVVFLPWYLCEDYVMTWAEYRRQRIALGWDKDLLPERFSRNEGEQGLVDEVADQIVRDGEEWHRHPFKLTESQLVWRRHAIEKKCDGKVEVFQREYPSTLEECWTATAKLLVSPETVEHYWSMSKDPTRGEVILEGPGREPKFVERGDGSVNVWALPKVGRKYVIGADVSDGSERGDGQAASVVDKESLEQVATVYAALDSDHYAGLLCRVGRWYNKALLAIENNYDPSCAKTARDLGYPHLYYYVDPENTLSYLGRAPKAGWSTNRRTRRLMIAALAGVARDREWICHDKEWAAELQAFVWNDTKQRFQASSGKHDDRIMASAIAVFLTGKRGADGRRLAVGSEVTDRGSGAYLEFMREQELADRSENGVIYL